MKYGFIFLFTCFALNSCTEDADLKPISLGPLFHDTNSKVWIVDKIISGNKNFAPSNTNEKDIVIFYENGKCVFQPMRTLGDSIGKKGDYSLNSYEQKISMYFQKEKWDFNISTLSKDTIILFPQKSSNFKYELVLLPFPEL